MAEEKSSPVGTAPRHEAAAVTSPVPQHKSSTCEPSATPAASSSTSTNCAVARAKVASYPAAACCQPACSKARTDSGSKSTYCLKITRRSCEARTQHNCLIDDPGPRFRHD